MLLALDGQQRVISDLGCCVTRIVGILLEHEALLPCVLLQLLVLRALDQIVDTSLSQEVCLRLLCRAGLAIAGPLVHPVHAIDTLATTGSLELPLKLFLGTLLLNLIDALLGALALG